MVKIFFLPFMQTFSLTSCLGNEPQNVSHPGISAAFWCGAMELWRILHPCSVSLPSLELQNTLHPHIPQQQWLATNKVTTHVTSQVLHPRLTHPWGEGLSKQH